MTTKHMSMDLEHLAIDELEQAIAEAELEIEIAREHNDLDRVQDLELEIECMNEAISLRE